MAVRESGGVRRSSAGHESVLKTLLVSDLVSSTALVGHLGDRKAAAVFQQHDRLARDLLAQYKGLEIDKTDGFLLLFERPWQAVCYALAYHQVIEDLSNSCGIEITARVGIHLGEVILRRNTSEDVVRGAKPIEVEGLAKPMAARVMSLAMGRQTLLTRGAFDLAQRSAVGSSAAVGHLQWISHGSYFFKGFVESVEVFEVGAVGVAPLMKPASSEKVKSAEVLASGPDARRTEPRRHHAAHRVRVTSYLGAILVMVAGFDLIGESLKSLRPTTIGVLAVLPFLMTLGVEALSDRLLKRREVRLAGGGLYGSVHNHSLARLTGRVDSGLRGLLAPLSLALWLTTLLVALPAHSKRVELRTLKELNALGALSVPVEDGYRVLLDDSLDRGRLSRVWSLLQSLSKLRELQLSNTQGVSGLEPLANLNQLRLLALADLVEVSDLENLRQLTALEQLIIRNLSGVTDLEPLSSLANLEKLELMQLLGVATLEPIRNLQGLRELALSDLGQIEELEPISHLKALQKLSLVRLNRVPDEEVAALSESLPLLEITRELAEISKGPGLAAASIPRQQAAPQDKKEEELIVSATTMSAFTQDEPLQVGGMVKRPRPHLNPIPFYTEEALRAGLLQEYIVARLTIDHRGHVTDIEVLKGAPMGLTEAATKVLRDWRFDPARLSGHPVAVYYNIAVPFRRD